MSNNGTRYSEEFKQQIADLYNSGSSVSYLNTKVKDEPLELCLAFKKCERNKGDGTPID